MHPPKSDQYTLQGVCAFGCVVKWGQGSLVYPSSFNPCILFALGSVLFDQATRAEANHFNSA